MANMSFDDTEERIDFVYGLMAQGLYFGQIKRAFRAKFGEASHVTIGKYVAKAKQQRRKIVEKFCLEEERQKHVELCWSIIQDPKARPGDKIRASEHIANLQGLNAPEKHEHTATVVHERKPITIDWDAMRRLRNELFGAPAGHRPAQPIHDAGSNGSPAALPGTDRD